MCTKLELTKAQIGTFIGLTTQELLENVISSPKLMQQTIIHGPDLKSVQTDHGPHLKSVSFWGYRLSPDEKEVI